MDSGKIDKFECLKGPKEWQYGEAFVGCLLYVLASPRFLYKESNYGSVFIGTVGMRESFMLLEMSVGWLKIIQKEKIGWISYSYFTELKPWKPSNL